MRASEDEDIVRRAFANVGIGKSSPADPPPVDSLDAYGANGHHAESEMRSHRNRAGAHQFAKTPINATTPSLGEWDAGDDVDLPPPRGWLLGNQFCRGFLSGLLAPGSTGKSALRLLQFLSLATGRPLSGQQVFKRCRVLVVSLEDGKDELRRRIVAARIHHEISPAELRGWLFCAAPKGFKLAEVKSGTRQVGELEKMLRQTIERRRPDLVSLDPFVKLHALEENDNGAMDFVCDLLVQLAIEYDIAVDAHTTPRKARLSPAMQMPDEVPVRLAMPGG